MQCARSITGQVGQPHQTSVGAFARPILPQNLHAKRQAILEVPSGLAIAHQFVEHGQPHVLQPLALIQAPIRIPPLQQVSPIECDRPLQGGGHLCPKVLAGNAVGQLEGRLEFAHIEPVIRTRGNANPIGLDQDQPFRLALRKQMLHLPQRLPEVLLRLRGGRRLPEQFRQALA